TSSPIWSTSRMFLPQQSFNISKCSTSLDLSNNDDTQISLDDNNLSRILCETASFVLLESIRWLYSVPSFKELNEYDQLILIEQSWSILFLLTSAEMKKFLEQTMNNELHDRLLIDKYRKDAFLMLADYTKNEKYRRLAELLLLLSNIQEKMNGIHLDKIFFQHLINRISMKNLLHNIVRHLSTFIQ
ncbi:unnamed protein product, partial [Adineta steineri]